MDLVYLFGKRFRNSTDIHWCALVFQSPKFYFLPRNVKNALTVEAYSRSNCVPYPKSNHFPSSLVYQNAKIIGPCFLLCSSTKILPTHPSYLFHQRASLYECPSICFHHFKKPLLWAVFVGTEPTVRKPWIKNVARTEACASDFVSLFYKPAPSVYHHPQMWPQISKMRYSRPMFFSCGLSKRAIARAMCPSLFRLMLSYSSI